MEYKSIPLHENYEISTVILGEGRYGKVFLGKLDKQEVAIKFESTFQKETLLINEAKILKSLISKNGSSDVGIPNFYESFENEDGNYMVMELLGENLKEKQKVHKFSLEEIGKIGVDILNTLQFIHECSYVYVDVKPENFLFGKFGKNKDKLYIVDYGLSQCYLDSKGNHKRFNENYDGVRGSVYYASVWNHYGIEYGRRDDVIALGFVLLKLLKGELPWENLNVPMYYWFCYEEAVLSRKIWIQQDVEDHEKFYKDVPENLKKYMENCWWNPFEDAPDYDYLRKLLFNLHK